MSRARDLADGTFSGAVAAASGDFTGTIEAADLSDGTLTVGTEYVTNGSAKAWINYDQDPATIRNSFNASSITDNAVGTFTTNLTNSMSGNNDYALSTSMYVTTTDTVRMGVLVGIANTGGGESQHLLAGSFRMATAANVFNAGGGAMGDYDVVMVAAHGDLA